MPKSTLENWVRADKKGVLGEVGKSQRPLTELEVELVQAKQELVQVKMKRDILKGRSVLCHGVAARYALMKESRLDYPLEVMSVLFNVSRSGYYQWLQRKPSKRAQEEPRLVAEVKAAHQRKRETYGPERLQGDLADHGISVGVHRFKRIRKEHEIRCKQKKRHKAMTNSQHPPCQHYVIASL